MAATEVTREILGNVPIWMVRSFYALAALATAVALTTLARRLQRQRQARGEPQGPTPPVGRRLVGLAQYLFFQDVLRRDRFAGLAHLLTVHGFIILFIGTCIVFLEHQTPLHFFYGRFYQVSSLVIDFGGLIFVVGLLMFIYRRHAAPPTRLLQRWWIAALAWLLLVIALSGFLLEGLRIAVDLPPFERWSAVGYLLALALRAVGVSGESATSLHQLVWAGHAVVCIVFFASLPVCFFAHMLYGAASWTLRRKTPLAQLRTPQSPSTPPGATTPADLAWTDLLQADACTTCGRCTEACPAAAAGKTLRPRDVVLAVREAVDAAAPDLTGSAVNVADAALWACTTCGACNEACPVGIDVYDKVVELRRGRVEAGTVPDAAADLFAHTVESFNPFGKPNTQRLDWAAGLQPPVAADDEHVELLYWVGCAGSFDPDGQAVTRAMVTILERLGVSYRVLGPAERCTGDPARRLGEEGLYQQCAAHNIGAFAAHGVQRILTHCPHCFNTFKNEYPALGGSYEVEHHSQFLQRHIDAGELPLHAVADQPITFHDPCYLGRGNGETAAPRAVLDALAPGQQREMPRHGETSFCCGAGGGALWLDEPGDQRVEDLRSAEAAATGATTVATGCPYCKVMLTAGSQNLDGTQPVVRDLAELVADQLTET
jgi:Fe-S oxidoreductase